MDGIDPGLLAKDTLPRLPESSRVVNDRSTNWTVVPCPTPGWAQLVHPDLDPEEALDRLWDEIAHICRLDESDPVAGWQSRIDALQSASSRLGSLRLDALRFDGPGTELTVGLLPTSIWNSAMMVTVGGIRHLPNIPTEEVFTTPDPERVDGVLRSTKPLFTAGTLITGLRMRFEKGRVVAVDADHGAETLREIVSTQEGADRIGEVALVDSQSRVGQLDTVFFETLLDENAASHMALGQSYEFAVGEQDRARANRSAAHIDFMIGSDQVAVTGLTADGGEIPLLRDGAWCS
jgi:aminopeptidase